ncbi:MAG TPA: DUF6152 family protein [Gammaproteobacteria bacterium]|jgi:hypothetical protein
MKRQSKPETGCHGARLKAGAIAGGAVAALAASLPLAAHHSFSAEFDSTKELTATGAVTEVEWQNPHAWIHLRVTELCERTAVPRGSDEEPAEWACREPGADEGAAWAFELGSPNGLMRQGWTRNSLQTGDVVTISGTRARDGSTNSNARNVTKADGTRLFAGSSENVTP